MNMLKNISIFIFILFFSSALSFALQEKTQTLSDDNIVSFVKDRNIIYAASRSCVYKQQSGNNEWQKVYDIAKANKQINRLYIDLLADNIYVATQDGLYMSQNQGLDWQRIFRGSSDLENDCISIDKSNKAIYLGTKQGLFISYDKGIKWHKSFEQFSDSIISSLIVDPQDDNIVYAACEKGVFITEDNGKSWKRIYVVYCSEIPSEDYGDYDSEVTEQISSIKSMAISPNGFNRLYIATAKGIFFTDNKGNKWQKLTNSGLLSFNIRSLKVSPLEKQLFVAMDKGVFKLTGNSWQKVDSDLANSDFNDLEIDEDGRIWLAGKGGIFLIGNDGTKNITKNNKQVKGIDNTEFDINELCKGEPSIEEIQKAAIEYAEVNIDKIKKWRNEARWKALCPTISVGYDKNVYGSSTGAMAVGPRGWDMDFSWDISELIWNADQTSIDSRSRLTVQLRQDVLDQVTRLYYERLRMKTEILLIPAQDEIEKLHKELEFQEITANLDGLTNGYFSKILRNKKQ
ncbi:MAG: hypothetical protein PHS93_03750 [Candidatus Omnitrophica bacterium]|nr:hypothetical protein [Candidatus Omnitrophota bacterium]MDD5352266.1 hypothetical protein [Candidatus Omnitrophota bacterium]MDD5549864.1 hypothetical protein [Candidatus Omnitrophota bacterium]